MPALRALLPAELEIDTFEGRAYVGVVPFTMRDVAPRWAPPVPGISHFHELNVRTYVTWGGRIPGVWFFSLDAAGSVAVVAARAGWSLPYHRASMDLVRSGDEVTYRSRRLWPGPRPAELDLRYVVRDAIGPATPGTFEHFLAERYVLFARNRKGRLLLGHVHHRPYPLKRAEVISVRESMVRAAGLPAPSGAPHVLFSPGVDVDIHSLVPVEESPLARAAAD